MEDSNQNYPAKKAHEILQTEALRNSALTLEGRSFGVATLAGGQALGANEDPGNLLFVFVLQGALRTSAGILEKGDAGTATSPADITGEAGGAVVGVLRWKDEPSPWRQRCLRIRPTSTWYDKYQARVGPVEPEPAQSEIAGQPLAPWSAYSITIPPSDAEVVVHVHHDLHNLVFVCGEPGEIAGYLMAEHGESFAAAPLHGGDIALVHPGTRHNLFAREDKPLHFFVLNTVPSHYQDAESSDYHNLFTLPRTELPLLPRRFPGPTYVEAR